MSEAGLSTSDILMRLGNAAKKIDELVEQLYLTQDRRALELASATQSSLKQLQKCIQKQFLYLENCYVSLLDDARLNVRFTVNGRSLNVPFIAARAGDFLCHRNTLLYYNTDQPLYFNSKRMRDLPKGTMVLDISITCVGKPPAFWLFETRSTGETNKSSYRLANGNNIFRLRIASDSSHVAFALRFSGRGSCRINSIRVEQNALDLHESFPKLPKPIKSLKIAYILDQLSEAALSPSAQFLPLQKGDFKNQLKEFVPDFLLVESCWNGNGVFGAFNAENRGEVKLAPLLDACRELNIPTVFWNKEDPWHYEKFVNVANLFDYIFTTDANMIPRYKSDIARRVHCLPFAAQRRLHFPGRDKNDKAFFAGSWYTDKPERCADFLEIDRHLKESGIEYDIYDRCQNMGLERYAWPHPFHKQILGQLTPQEVFKKSREYKFQVNTNSVKSSPTMFSRRVFESMAAGTPIIGNYSEGVERMFPGLTIMFGDGRDDSELLHNLNTDQKAYYEYREKGILAVMREHTYEHRLEEICRIIGIEAKADEPAATMVFEANNYEEAERAEFQFNKQGLKNKKLLLRLHPFDRYYQFLNRNSLHRRYMLASENSNEQEREGLTLYCDATRDYTATYAELQIYANPGEKEG